MQKRIYNILPIAIVFFTVMALVLVSGAGTQIGGPTPVANANYTLLTINCTTNVTACDECLNATIWYDATGAQALWTTELCTIVNDTEDDIEFLSTDNTACATAFELLTDGLLYNFTCSFANETSSGIVNATNVIANVGVDNTVPSITPTTDFSEINLHRFTKYSTAISDATAGLDGTEACTITGPQGDVTTVSTSASINDDIWDDTGIPGTYTLSCTATDTATNTDTVSTTFEVKTTGPPVERDGVSLGILDKIKGLDSRVWIIIAIIVVIVLATRKKS